MRQALNNAQATQAGFGLISQENVFKVCDQPHPLFVKEALQNCIDGDFKAANAVVEQLWSAGYCGLDIVGTFFRIVKPVDTAAALASGSTTRPPMPQP